MVIILDRRKLKKYFIGRIMKYLKDTIKYYMVYYYRLSIVLEY